MYMGLTESSDTIDKGTEFENISIWGLVIKKFCVYVYVFWGLTVTLYDSIWYTFSCRVEYYKSSRYEKKIIMEWTNRLHDFYDSLMMTDFLEKDLRIYPCSLVC